MTYCKDLHLEIFQFPVLSMHGPAVERCEVRGGMVLTRDLIGRY